MGRSDIPLTARGQRQARQLGGALAASLEPCPLYVSPLLRTRQTAEALVAAGFPSPAFVPDLQELDFGAWEGRLAEEVEREHPADYGRWRAVEASFAFPGGEPLAAAAGRMLGALRSAWDSDADAVVVAHGGVLRLGVCELLGLPWSAASRLRFDFASVTRLERHGGREVLALLNDTGHLEEAS